MSGYFGESEFSDAVSKPKRKTRVFISYSRMDKEFARKLVEALGARGFEAFMDTKDILPGENWQRRLGFLILSADTVVFVLSPNSVTSEICLWEVESAERDAKRILPVVWRAVTGEVPDRLKRLNYIYFTDDKTFEASCDMLSTAIETDIGWLREHTRLTEAAMRWMTDRFGYGHALLRGPDLRDAERWLTRRPASAPEPLQQVIRFINSSRNFASPIGRLSLWLRRMRIPW